MSRELLFYILLLLWLVFGFWTQWPAPGPSPVRYRPLGGHVLLFVLFLLIGWEVFGAPLK